MTSAEVLFGFAHLQVGKTYVAFNPETLATFWWGTVLGVFGGGKLALIDQCQSPYGMTVVVDQQLPKGECRPAYRQMEADDGILLSRPESVLSLDVALGLVAAECMMEDHALSPENIDQAVVRLARCVHGWYYEVDLSGVPVGPSYSFSGAQKNVETTITTLLLKARSLCARPSCAPPSA